MKCPACFNALKEIQVGNLRVDVCQNGCGGIWFDAFELEQADEEREAVGEPLLHIERDQRVIVDFARKRECPRCTGIKLHQHFFSAKRRVQVDQCPNCGGYWLDAGELAQIREERAETAAELKEQRFSLSGQDLRYLYGLRGQPRKG